MTAVVPLPEPQVEPMVEIERARYMCASCAYGVGMVRLPERCPMCGDHAWLPEPRKG